MISKTIQLNRLLFIIAIGISSASCANDDADKVNVEKADAAKTQLQHSPVSESDETSGEISDTLAHGEKAHQVHCYKCHTDDVYTRENRFVKSIDALSKQVVRCKDGTDATWFDEDTDAVVQFLNNKYYRF